MKRSHLPFLILPVFALLLAGLQSAAPLQPQVQDDTPVTNDDLFELRKNFEIFGAIYEEIVLGYVNEIRPQAMMKSGVDAMLANLDPYTRFYDQADNIESAQMRRSPRASVGLNVGIQEGRLTVLAPEHLTSGYRQGVRIGDRVLTVDGVDVAEITVRDVVVLLQGEEGTTATLEIERPGTPGTLTFNLPREIATTRNVSYSGYLNGDSVRAIGYVKLDAFGTRSAREVRRAYRTMLRGAGLKGAVLDLRDNPGGLVNEAVELTGLFVPTGTRVVSLRGRDEQSARHYVTENDPLLLDIPVVVLVSKYSASASEIVSGALQDLDRAVIMGETTFGKGLVQIGRELPYNTSMRITVGHYYTPEGRDLQSWRIASDASGLARPAIGEYRTRSGRRVRSGVGIEPDVLVDASIPSELEEALMQQGAFFRFANEASNVEAVSAMEDGALLSEFRDWLDQISFSYESSVETALIRLQDSVPE